mmetsp:Transcript_7851/g.15806  ORF Transcript_7851/g.15806 Transcript_7851/m.15806 type:complete len:317 (-) Transcript_7851:2155-3105(-)
MSVGRLKRDPRQAYQDAVLGKEVTRGRLVANLEDMNQCIIVQNHGERVLVTRSRVDETGTFAADIMKIHRDGTLLAHVQTRRRCQWCGYLERTCDCPRPLWERSVTTGRSHYESWNEWLRHGQQFKEKSIDNLEARIFDVRVQDQVLPIHGRMVYYHTRSPELKESRAIFSEYLCRSLPRADKMLVGFSSNDTNIRTPSILEISSDEKPEDEVRLAQIIDARRFVCSQCGVSFSSKGNLRRHEDSAHGSFAGFHCKHCGRSFKQRANLQRHETSVHLGRKSWICAFCRERFGTKSNLSRHHRRMHLSEIRDRIESK